MNMLGFAQKLEKIAETVGKLASWLTIVMMAVIVGDVILRRYFVIGSTGLQELEWHLHGALFLLCLGYASLKGSHVRIELFREKWSLKTKAIVEVFGTLFLLIPLCVALIIFGFDYTAMSYAYSEKSAAATGLGALWFIKGVMVFGVVILLFPAIATLIKAVLWLKNPTEELENSLRTMFSDETDTA